LKFNTEKNIELNLQKLLFNYRFLSHQEIEKSLAECLEDI